MKFSVPIEASPIIAMLHLDEARVIDVDVGGMKGVSAIRYLRGVRQSWKEAGLPWWKLQLRVEDRPRYGYIVVKENRRLLASTDRDCIPKFAVLVHWCRDNCTGKWAIGRDRVSFDDQVDAELFLCRFKGTPISELKPV